MASIIAQDDPIGQRDEILKLVKKNYMVRTYADFNQNGVCGSECVKGTGKVASVKVFTYDGPLYITSVQSLCVYDVSMCEYIYNIDIYIYMYLLN